MEGFSLLRRVFLMQAVLVILGLGLLIVGIIGATIFALSR
jgi:preprotein translocase subunit Sss1